MADRPSEWTTGRPNLVAAYPAHVPMGLPLPSSLATDDASPGHAVDVSSGDLADRSAAPWPPPAPATTTVEVLAP